MRHRAIDRLRARGRRLKYIDQGDHACAEHDGSLNGRMPLLATERGREVRSALAALGVGEHRAIELAFFDGLTHVEIATALSVPVGTVKARIRRGMLKLRAKLAALSEDGLTQRLQAGG